MSRKLRAAKYGMNCKLRPGETSFSPERVPSCRRLPWILLDTFGQWSFSLLRGMFRDRFTPQSTPEGEAWKRRLRKGICCRTMYPWEVILPADSHSVSQELSVPESSE